MDTKPVADTATELDLDEAATRRSVLRRGAGLAVTLAGASQGLAAPAVARDAISLPKAPNIVVLMTDQERHHMHWPAGWAEKNLPGLQRLKRNGLYFNRAYTAACQCSPSRAVMTTGHFSPMNRVTRTFLWPGLGHQDRLPSIASLLSAKAGYEVVWKGKWHLSYATNAAPGNGGEAWTAADIDAMKKNFGWSDWNPPDAGNSIEEWETNVFGRYNGMATLGGGHADNDGRYIKGANPTHKGQTPGFGESVIEFLKHRAPRLGKPFCLFVSLVNPHDVYVYPTSWKTAGYERADFADLGIDLPPNYADDLSKKPSVQRAARDAFNKFAPLDGTQAERDYVNFYAYLNKLADQNIVTVLDTLEETGLMADTIVLRLADHGEGGLSHGMREKAYTVYEEMIHVPLIVHNPGLYPEPLQTDAFYDHLDLLPTILDLAGVSNPESWSPGKSIVPIIRDPAKSVKDSTIFAYDDVFFLPAGTPGGHIRAMREGDWTYAVYFSLDGSGLEYELYNLKADPRQMQNLLYGDPAPDIRKEWSRLHERLTRRFIAAGYLPDSFQWPVAPTKT